jgi:hypothetical protein
MARIPTPDGEIGDAAVAACAQSISCSGVSLTPSPADIALGLLGLLGLLGSVCRRCCWRPPLMATGWHLGSDH